MHIDVSIIKLTIILTNIWVLTMMLQPTSYYSSFFHIFKLSFQLFISHIIPMSYYQQQLLISSDHILLQLSGLYKHLSKNFKILKNWSPQQFLAIGIYLCHTKISVTYSYTFYTKLATCMKLFPVKLFTQLNGIINTYLAISVNYHANVVCIKYVTISQY